MLKTYLKLKRYLNNKGFTLVELLAVIVVLAIIMLIAIPAVLSVLESARIKTFIEYIDKSAGLAQKQLAEDQMNGNMASACVIYNIKTDLGLSNTGSFEGWVLIDSNNIYITLFNDDYGLAAYHYNDPSLKVEDYIKKKSAFEDDQLSIDYLCGNSTCSTCIYKDEDGSKIVDNEEFIKKNSALLDTGPRVREILIREFYSLKKFKKAETMPENLTDRYLISSNDSNYPIWVWRDGEYINAWCFKCISCAGYQRQRTD